MSTAISNPRIVRIASNKLGLAAALCGDVRVSSANRCFRHNTGLLASGTRVEITYNGEVVATGIVAELIERIVDCDTWSAVAWQSFNRLPEPKRYRLPYCGRRYVEVIPSHPAHRAPRAGLSDRGRRYVEVI